MKQKKVAVLGSVAVGKTSLTERYVSSIYSERYHSTVGVRIHRKQFSQNGEACTMIIWDLAGGDEFARIRRTHLKGASGYLLVADGTREDTLARAVEIQESASEDLGDAPFVLAINKFDLSGDWAVQDSQIRDLERIGWTVFRTSAKDNIGVEAAFESIARRLWSSHAVS